MGGDHGRLGIARLLVVNRVIGRTPVRAMDKEPRLGGGAMETPLQKFITIALVTAFVLLLLADVVDDVFMTDKWNIPPEVFGLMGGLIVAVFRLTKRNNGNGKGTPRGQEG